MANNTNNYVENDMDIADWLDVLKTKIEKRGECNIPPYAGDLAL